MSTAAVDDHGDDDDAIVWRSEFCRCCGNQLTQLDPETGIDENPMCATCMPSPHTHNGLERVMSPEFDRAGRQGYQP